MNNATLRDRNVFDQNMFAADSQPSPKKRKLEPLPRFHEVTRVLTPVSETTHHVADSNFGNLPSLVPPAGTTSLILTVSDFTDSTTSTVLTIPTGQLITANPVVAIESTMPPKAKEKEKDKERPKDKNKEKEQEKNKEKDSDKNKEKDSDKNKEKDKHKCNSSKSGKSGESHSTNSAKDGEDSKSKNNSDESKHHPSSTTFPPPTPAKPPSGSAVADIVIAHFSTRWETFTAGLSADIKKITTSLEDKKEGLVNKVKALETTVSELKDGKESELPLCD